MLPTELDVAKYFLFEKIKYKIDNQTNKDPDNSVISDIVVDKVISQYVRASIPTIRKDKIKQRVLNVYNKRLSIQKIPVQKRYIDPEATDKVFSDFFIRQREEFHQSVSGLFDVADNAMVPKIELEFLNDQRGDRKMVIVDTIDKEETNKRKRRFETERKCQERRIAESRRKESIEVVRQNEMSDEEDPTQAEQVMNDLPYEPVQSSSKLVEKFITIKAKKHKHGTDLKAIAETAVRNNVSNRATVAIVNATLRTYQIPDIIDKSKFRRSVSKIFEEVDSLPIEFGGGLCYDGRKDLTLTKDKIDGKYYQSTRTEEHISLISLPDNKYMGHITPPDGKAQTIADCIINFIAEKNSMDLLKVISCDGTNTNVGAEGGIKHIIEMKLGRPLHWFICLLHANELPLRHLITELDGPTSGANTFTGPIGKSLSRVKDMSVVSYNSFSCSQNLSAIPEIVWKDLSTDQKYMWRIVTSLIRGNFDKDLEHLTIGPVCHSRWLTTACRICCLYACTAEPSQNLIILTSYIVNIYAPMWFTVKYHELAIHGPENLFFLISKSEAIENQRAKNIVQQCIQRNAFFAHPENILLAQLASELKSDRVDAVKTIIDSRSQIYQNTEVRAFRVPPINFKAKKWQHMINWSETDLHEPPIISNKTNNEQKLLLECHWLFQSTSVTRRW